MDRAPLLAHRLKYGFAIAKFARRRFSHFAKFLAGAVEFICSQIKHQNPTGFIAFTPALASHTQERVQEVAEHGVIIPSLAQLSIAPAAMRSHISAT